MVSCFDALSPSGLSRRPRPSTRETDHLRLPDELWSEILRMLDTPDLVAASRTNCSFNALAIPLYLSRHGIPTSELSEGSLHVRSNKILPILQTAFFLPPIRKLSCLVPPHRRYEIVRYLHRLISQQEHLESIYLNFYTQDSFNAFHGFGRDRKVVPRRTMQKIICQLLNSMTPAGRTVALIEHRMFIISGSDGRDLWRTERSLAAPPRGVRAKLRHAIKALSPRRAPAPRDLVLHAFGEESGIVSRGVHILDGPRIVQAAYATPHSDHPLAVITLGFVRKLTLRSSLSPTDWACVLPALKLFYLEELLMCGAPVCSTVGPALQNVASDVLDTFLARHTTILRLEYAPQPPASAPLPSVGPFSLAALPYLTHLTIPPAHFVRLHNVPGDAPALQELTLRPGTCATLRLHIPAAWAVVPPPDLEIACVTSLLLYAFDPPADPASPALAPFLVPFLAPFAPGLRRVELLPARARTAAHLRVVDELRQHVAWLEDVACARVEGGRQMVSSKKNRQIVKLKYEDD
ncbi:hypothetical protein GGX14DRAFT_570286 [Mycena pura]|uniref:F-box domain-containing protein n=1 Tax=Mycena pura TaxID=153505 RepID=A0AAD6V5D5_9AGAR|nr:hypothetical protein GGX14DRAFT_570286 [Mycena pura]